jgi:hypothetical protein
MKGLLTEDDGDETGEDKKEGATTTPAAPTCHDEQRTEPEPSTYNLL